MFKILSRDRKNSSLAKEGALANIAEAKESKKQKLLILMPEQFNKLK